MLTLDIDWAPDFMIDQVADILIQNRVKATWFVTHASPAIGRLREHADLFELGLHPNMLAGSTHGATEDEALQHVRKLLPEAIAMRTHGLYQTSNFLIKAASDYGVRVDASLYLPPATHLSPHQVFGEGVTLWRVPYFWEDDSEMHRPDSLWDVDDERLNGPGLRIFDFHPVHIVLNTQGYRRYQELKQGRPLLTWDADYIKGSQQSGPGPATMFNGLVDRLAGGGLTISELIADVEAA